MGQHMKTDRVFGKFFLVVGLALCVSASAAIMQFPEKSLKKVEGGGLEVPVYPTVKVTNGGLKDQTLYLTGAGLRQKKVVLFTADVYVAASYVDSKPNPGLAAMTVADAKVKAMQLTFVRNVSASQIRDSFQDALKENGADISSIPIQNVLSKLTFELPEKSTLSILSHSVSPQEDVLYFEASDHKFSVRGPALGKTFWSMWFGIPVDGGIEALQSALLGKN